uniref:Uncharacterized protein n=1 Tax=Anguilla anguilla TaxID=7936 RepID=A0A0E9RQ56_ANGAN
MASFKSSIKLQENPKNFTGLQKQGLGLL